MKTFAILLLFAFVSFSSSLYSKTLVVREYGKGTPYSNIQQAHNAATDGDTIAVDAATDGSWDEGTTITVSKQVYLTTLQSRKLKLVSGVEVKLLNNRKLSISDLDSTYFTLSGTGECTMVNCFSRGDIFVPSTIKFRCFQSTVMGRINAFYLKALGNYLQGGVFIDSASNYSDSVLILGNIINRAVIVLTNNCIILSNNYIKTNEHENFCYNSNILQNNTLYWGTGIFCRWLNHYKDFVNIISNNTLWYTSNYGAGSILYVHNPDSRKLNCHSNSLFFSLSGNGFTLFPGECSGGGARNLFMNLTFNDKGISFSKNYFAAFSQGVWAPMSPQSKNYFGTSIPTIDSLGRLSGPDFTDKGLDLPEFSDIDLTRNDIGTEGGPWPISNFWGPNASTAWVNWVDLPLKISTPQTPIKIKATATAK
jgi:hypothetical protein